MSECIQISLDKYNLFCNKLKSELGDILSLELFKKNLCLI